jgi:hypothetical protein
MTTATLDIPTASSATDQTEVVLAERALLGEPLVESAIDYDEALAHYPTDYTPIDEPDWSVGGTPFGI